MRRLGSASTVRLRVCAASKRNPCCRAISSIRKCTIGSLCPVKPMKRIFPAFCAATTASIAPPSEIFSSAKLVGEPSISSCSLRSFAGMRSWRRWSLAETLGRRGPAETIS